MDFNVEIQMALLQALWDNVTQQAIELVSETRDVMLNKNSFQEFSNNIFKLKSLLGSLNAKKNLTN